MNYKEPFVKVLWQDVPENFTNERIRRLKSFFQEKYKAKNVQVITKNVIENKDTKLKSLDVSESVLDINHQKSLMKDFIKENNIEVDWNKIDRLDSKVNERIVQQNQNKIKYNKWFIKKIEFSNFLSFGQNNLIDFTQFNGLTVVESNPRNFGGKSTATVDLLMFLFFNSTTKTKVNADLFNKFSDNDEVLVKGYITIDDEDYIIERKLSRKKTKIGDYTITNKLEFYKIKPNGTFENLNGEQRRETEIFITSALGTEEDFLTTILTTSTNLEQLIDSKPTARGVILTKFLGLDNLKQKEDIAKEIYNEWSKKLISNTYNIKDLELSIEENNKKIFETNNLLNSLKDKLNKTEENLNNIEQKKEILQLKRNNDVVTILTKVNATLLSDEIEKTKRDILKIKDTLKNINVVEPKEYFLEEEYEKKKEKYDKINYEKLKNLEEIKRKEILIEQLEKGEICPTCNRKLDDVDHTEEVEKIKKEIVLLNRNNYDSIIEKLNEELKKYKELKIQFDTYEKNKLLLAKNELEIEQKTLDINQKKAKLDEYYKNEKKLEENKKIDSDLLALKTEIDTCRADIRVINENINKNKVSINNLKDKNNNSIELIKKIKIEEDTINIFKIYFLIFGKNGISKVIMKNMIPLLNNELYRLLIDSCYFILELNINDKNEVEFIMIDTETRVVKPLASGSGYEKTISSLALRSVLAKISSLPKPNVIVMDEVFGKIADENLEMVGEFFKKIKNYFEHILIISHNPLIRNWTDNIIMIKKEHNISSIDFIEEKNLMVQ
jgi:DNA repair exonuclease SbcCD ATPase subunit